MSWLGWEDDRTLADQSCVIVVSDHADEVSGAVANNLQVEGIPVVYAGPGALGDLCVHLRGDSFAVNGQSVGGIFLRSSPESVFGEGFAARDRAFCDAEIRAVWLAALHLESVLAINRYDPAAWFEAAGWPVWRWRLIEAGVPVSPFGFGDVEVQGARSWYPYRSSRAQSVPSRATRRVMGCALAQSTWKQVSLVVCGHVLEGELSSSVESAAQLLNESGVQIAEIATDNDGCVLSVNTQPRISEARTVEQAGQLIGEAYRAHMHRW
jgi:hypothetical protein